MGYADYGGGRSMEHEHHGGDERQGPDRARTGTPDVAVTLIARKQKFQLARGDVDGYTLNGTSPGPLIRARSAIWSR